jgi:transitional endoplasmic reticulum ATPase
MSTATTSSTTTSVANVASRTQAAETLRALKAQVEAAEKAAAAAVVEVKREGDVILVPEGMSLSDARKWLQRKEEEENQKVRIDETVHAFPLEGAYAFARAISRKYGFSAMVPTPSFFGPKPPMMIGVEIGINQTVQVPWGRVEIPGVDGALATAIGWKDGRFVFRVVGEVKQKHKAEIAHLVQLTRDIARDESIYRGKAIRVSFPENPNPDEMDPTQGPTFIDVSKVNEDELVFSGPVDRAIRTSVFTPIEKTALCRKYEVPLKRGILLEGPFGTGKTLTAYVTAKKCVENGWTFIYLDKVKSLEQAIHFAKAYQPAVIFAEDIDSVMAEDENRTEKIDGILNTIDGVDAKGMELEVILTTNNVQDIEPAMLRPGRLDAIITVAPPDAKAAVRLAMLYARGTLAPKDDYTAVGQKLAGQIPAVIREVVERSKLATLSRIGDTEPLVIRAIDLEFAADEMLAHLELLKEKPADERSDVEKAADRLGNLVAGAMLPASLKANGKAAAATA